MNNYPLTERIDKIETIVNSSEFMNSRQFISKKKGTWSRLRSCIGFIRDTEAALESYLLEVSKQLPIEKGKATLYILGIFQTLYIQQDTVKHLCASLDIKYPKNNTDLKEIRDIRNELGHPTADKYEGELGIEYTLIGNVSPYADFIHLTADFPNFKKHLPKPDNPNTQAVIRIRGNINIPEKIEKQKSIFISVLDKALETLNN